MEVQKDVVEDRRLVIDDTNLIKHIPENIYQKHAMKTKSTVFSNNPSIVYSVITTKDVAKYRPPSPEVIRR